MRLWSVFLKGKLAVHGTLFNNIKNLTILPLWIHPKAFCALIENRIAPVPSDSPPQRWKVQDCQSPSLWNSFSCLKWDFSCFLKPDRRSRGDFFRTDPLTLVPINSGPTVLRSLDPHTLTCMLSLGHIEKTLWEEREQENDTLLF